jgi:hypothetical protein
MGIKGELALSAPGSALSSDLGEVVSNEESNDRDELLEPVIKPGE